jgi:hypothetical protein
MPIPIAPMSGSPNDRHPMQDSPAYLGLDWSLLGGVVRNSDSGRPSKVSNTDAGLLFSFWKTSEATTKDGREARVVPKGFSNSDLLRLKALGFIHGDTDVVAFTERGTEVVKNLVLNEGSSFDGAKVQKPYSEILAEAEAKKRRGSRFSTGGKKDA